MKKKKFVCITAALLACPVFSWGATSVTKTGDLRFGDFVSLNSSGKVTVTPTGGRSAQGGVFLLPRGTVAAAQFVMSGKKNDRYAISLPADNTVYIASGGKNMPLSGFTCSIPLSGRLPGSGSQPFTVGATVTADPAKAPGIYSGNFTITLQ